MGDVVPLVGSIRGFRWWRVGEAADLLSPWRGPVRWGPGENEAACLARRGFFGWKMGRTPHPRGCPASDCECGFYALHSLPELNDGADKSIWEIDALTSGGRHGLVLGITEGYGRVLIGTAGWRARFARVLALFAGCTTGDRTRDIRIAANGYAVPLYHDLSAFVSEWGPDRETVRDLIA
jgi:hypothetical protein